MRYSVWQKNVGRYDVYETPSQTDAPPNPAHLSRSNPHGLGVAPEEAAYPLPLDAKLVGASPIPVGRIAAQKGALQALSGSIVSLSPVGKVAAAVGAYTLYRWWRKRRGK